MRWSLFSAGWIGLLAAVGVLFSAATTDAPWKPVVAVAAFGGLVLILLGLRGAGTGVMLLWAAWAAFPLIIGLGVASGQAKTGESCRVTAATPLDRTSAWLGGEYRVTCSSGTYAITHRPRRASHQDGLRYAVGDRVPVSYYTGRPKGREAAAFGGASHPAAFPVGLGVFIALLMSVHGVYRVHRPRAASESAQNTVGAET